MEKSLIKSQGLKLSLLIFCVFLVFGMSLDLNQNTRPVRTVATPQTQSSHSDLSFAVLGDIHEDTDHFQDAIRDLYSINPALDVLVLNGDTVDQGIEKQYASIKKVLHKNQSLLPKTILKNIGNHEFFDYTIEENSPKEVQTFIHRYLEFAGEEKVYHDVWIKNYHFISLGSEDGNSQTNNSIKAYISEEQQQWLKDKLSENYIKGKPIFVFLHQPLNNNSKNGWIGTDQGDTLRKILSAYPEIILFTSHTHADLTDQSVLLDQPFTSVHTGAIHYTIVRHAQGQAGTREPYIKGLYIEVEGNTVIIQGRDFKQRTWIFSQKIN